MAGLETETENRARSPSVRAWPVNYCRLQIDRSCETGREGQTLKPSQRGSLRVTLKTASAFSFAFGYQTLTPSHLTTVVFSREISSTLHLRTRFRMLTTVGATRVDRYHIKPESEY